MRPLVASFYITTAIPYVNAEPHVGFALEAVQTDVLARERRQRGDDVRFLSGTDDNALKNVIAAEGAGLAVAEFVARNADRFEELGTHLDLSNDDYIRTSSDPRHLPGVERLWRAVDAAGDLYKRDYSGLYCVGCEQFYEPDELVDGRCPEHGTEPTEVAESNWFFRLSRYGDALTEAITTGRLRIEPEVKRNEVLSFIAAGLRDFSVSRSAERARGWGISVPGDDTQVIYVWMDALANYITALGYGTDAADYRRWWVEGDQRVHVIGKGIIRFHCVYWPAMLLSAGVPLPTSVLVHDYVTINGGKISKSVGNVIDPADVAEEYGADALRWWYAREVPAVGDTDFTIARLVDRANQDLANGLGNLINRTLTLAHKYGGGKVPDAPADPALLGQAEGLPAAISAALDEFDIRAGATAISDLIGAGNGYVQHERPWESGKAAAGGDGDARRRFDTTIATLITVERAAAEALRPFTPSFAAAALAQLGDGSDHLPEPAVLYPRLEI